MGYDNTLGMNGPGNTGSGTGGGGGTNWGAIGGGLLTLVGAGGAIGGLGGGPDVGGIQTDYDPTRRALGRYKELLDPNSAYWTNIQKYFGRIAAASQPTINTLYGFNKGAGISDTGATAIATEQARAQVGRTQEQVLSATERARMESESLAQGYLGLEYKRGSDYASGELNKAKLLQDQQSSSSSFFDSVLGLGGGLLTKFL